jgi:tripartite-type tricarboxylate transporter receptor subunit TctC
LRGLAVSSGKRFKLESQIPAISETLPSVDVTSWLGLAAAAATPQTIVERLNKEIREILALPEIQSKFAGVGNVPLPSTPQEMRERVALEISNWERVVAAKNIQRY